MKKLIALILILVIALTIESQPKGYVAIASSKYITVQSFSKLLAEKLGMTSEEVSTSTECVNVLLQNNIIKNGDFTSYSDSLKRGDMLVLLNRAEEYLNKTTVKAKLISTIIDKRISDINKVAASKQEDVAKGYSKGFLKGYSNGDYSTNRELKVNSTVSNEAAKACIEMLTNKSKRAKLSPDGQLLRSTGLPNNAKMFKYILASYPNRYYEAKLRFEGVETRINGVLVTLKSPEDYTYPKDVAKADFPGIKDYNDTRDKYLDLWMDRTYTHVWNTFNVNYKKIDDTWVETMAQTDSNIYNSSDSLYQFLDKYVSEMKANKTIVECDKVAMDGSSMYYYGGFYYIRCYVRYRIVSTKTKTSYSADEYHGGLWGPYNCVLYSRSGYSDITGYKLNKWTSAIYDIGISTGISGNDGSTFGVCDVDWSPYLFRSIERN